MTASGTVTGPDNAEPPAAAGSLLPPGGRGRGLPRAGDAQASVGAPTTAGPGLKLRRDRDAVTLVLQLAGPETTRTAERRTAGGLRPGALYAAYRVHRAGLVALYTLARVVRAEHVRAGHATRTAAELTRPEEHLLRLMARDLTNGEIAAVLGDRPSLVSGRIGDLLRALGVPCRHQAVALGCLAGVVAFDDVRPDLVPGADARVSAPAWLPGERLAGLLEALGKGRACAIVPHAGRHAVAEAVVRHRRAARVLVLTSSDPTFADTLTRWRTAAPAGVRVTGLVTASDRTRPVFRTFALDPRLLAGPDRMPGRLAAPGLAVVVASASGLAALAAEHRHRPDRLGEWDLVVSYDAPLHPAAVPGPDADVPAWARLYLGVSEEAVTSDRAERRRLPAAVTGPVALRVPLPVLTSTGSARSYRLLAAEPPHGASTEPMRLQMLLVDIAARYGLTRIHVHCAGDRDAAALTAGFAEAVRRTEPWLRPRRHWIGHLNARATAAQRGAVLRNFRSGPQDLRILATTEPVPEAGAEAYVHLAPAAPTEAVADAIGHALTSRFPADTQTLLLVAPVLTRPAVPVHAAAGHLASLSRAVAALDDDYRRHLADLRRHGHGITDAARLVVTGHTLDAHARIQLTHFCAWADTTWAEEYLARMGRENRAPDDVGPSGLPRAAVERAVRRLGQEPSPPRGTPGRRPVPMTGPPDSARVPGSSRQPAAAPRESTVRPARMATPAHPSSAWPASGHAAVPGGQPRGVQGVHGGPTGQEAAPDA
ncbi:hypothetical protein ACFRMQ_00380 [Kitasatospora sp. NPDC056783]|uniref:hypothetical protein n=1 Tax=Kitasatospora sp. NPDC056783 TaxID=3345943 RepID=UPI0036CFB8B6